MALAARCLGCRRRTSAGSYCSECWHRRRKIRTGWDWRAIRAQVHARDRVCVQCGSTDQLEVHHRIPLNDGGSNELNNLELLCKSCHEQTRYPPRKPAPELGVMLAKVEEEDLA